MNSDETLESLDSRALSFQNKLLQGHLMSSFSLSEK